METTYDQALEQLQDMFDKLDKQIIKSTLDANEGQIQKTVTDLLHIERELDKKKALEEEENNRRLSKKRTMSNQFNTGDLFSNQPNELQDTNFGFQFQQYNKTDKINKRRTTSMSLGGMGFSFNSKDLPKFPSSVRNSLPQDGKRYGPNGEEIPIGRNRRTGSIVQKLKTGLTNLFWKGSKDMGEKGDYEQIAFDEHQEVNNPEYQEAPKYNDYIDQDNENNNIPRYSENGLYGKFRL